MYTHSLIHMLNEWFCVLYFQSYVSHVMFQAVDECFYVYIQSHSFGAFAAHCCSLLLIAAHCCSLLLIAAHCRSLPLIAAHWAPLRYVYMFIATHCICYVLSRTHCCIIIAHWTLLLSPVMYISMLLWSGPVSALIDHYVFGYLCSGSVWALYAQIACFDWCHVYSDVIGSCILVMIGSLILIVIGSELFVALEIVFPEVTWCKVIMASTRVIAKFQCKEFIKVMYLDLAGHIRVRLRVLTVWSIFVLIMFYHRSIKLLHSFWWFTMTCKASLWCILRWISLFVCSKPLSHSRFPCIRDVCVFSISTLSKFSEVKLSQ